MTTIKVTVDSKKNARLLTKLLRSMAFVKTIEDDTPMPQEADQFTKLKEIIDAIEPGSIFRSIDKPVDWQKNLRDEWKTA